MNGRKVTLTLEFDTGSQEEMRDLTLTARVSDLAQVIRAMDESMRRTVKYGTPSGEGHVAVIEQLRALLRDELGDLTDAVLG